MGLLRKNNKNMFLYQFLSFGHKVAYLFIFYLTCANNRKCKYLKLKVFTANKLILNYIKW